MYTPPAFREDRPEVLREIMRAARLALLVSAAPDGGAPEATHLPLVLEEGEGPHGTLYGHIAKANAHWKGLRAAGAARAVFRGRRPMSRRPCMRRSGSMGASCRPGTMSPCTRSGRSR